MNSKLMEYEYPRKYIFIEEENNVFRKDINDSLNSSNHKYQWKFVDSIARKKVGELKYDLIQHDDKVLGWVELENSIQVYRFSQRHCKVIDEDYFDNDLNTKMDKIRNYKLLFKDKILIAKCEIIYNDEKYYGIFLNGQFQGFHHEKYIDFLIPFDTVIDCKTKEYKLFRISNLSKPLELESAPTTLNLIGVFPKMKIGKVKINSIKQSMWIDLNKLDSPVNLNINKPFKEEKILDDIFEYIKFEREKSKAIVDKVLEVKEYLQKGDDI